MRENTPASNVSGRRPRHPSGGMIAVNSWCPKVPVARHAKNPWYQGIFLGHRSMMNFVYGAAGRSRALESAGFPPSLGSSRFMSQRANTQPSCVCFHPVRPTGRRRAAQTLIVTSRSESTKLYAIATRPARPREIVRHPSGVTKRAAFGNDRREATGSEYAQSRRPHGREVGEGSGRPRSSSAPHETAELPPVTAPIAQRCAYRREGGSEDFSSTERRRITS